MIPHWIKHKINPFSSCQLRSRDKVVIARYKDDFLDLLLISKGSNINTDAHIDSALFHAVGDVVFF